MFKTLLSDRTNLLRTALLFFVAGIFVVATQAALFFHVFAPRVSQANIQLHELILEKAQKKLSTQIARQVEVLITTHSPADETERTLAEAWRDFQNHFSVAPVEALSSLQNELVVLTAGAGDADPANRLSNDIERLQGIYADDHKPLLAELKRPPWYLWPTAPVVAAKSGYRQAAMMNRAIYLAQTGEIGTARVMLAGLNASVDDASIEAKIYYTLARLQFELFRRTPEADYYTQSVQYLRQSLRTDPGYPLAKRMLDFLLSLDQAATAPQASEGRPESPSEGEGAAVSTEKRIF
ncbi:MAG: hypothetical protein HKN77_04415 [Woeseiaceae bacterium]|nr:hypothetical protein [Woeseiaceae bacterium]